AVPPPPAVTATSTPLIPQMPTIRSVATIREEPVLAEEEIVQPEKTPVDPVVRKEQIRRLWWLLGRP
ncbi:MAG: hypothetical protein GX911_05355, partial [Spirochaetales bacterium]|nr:hypothetical protein [Spirochaetales bacterium]